MGGDNDNNDETIIDRCNGEVVSSDPIMVLRSIRTKYVDNIIIASLNVNSIRNKFDQLSSVIQGNVDLLVVNETKVDSTFPTAQFTMEGYTTYRLDRDKNGGGIMIFIREDIPSKILQNHNLPEHIEAVPIEVNLRKTKFLFLAIYHPPSQSKKYFLECLTKILDKYSHLYEKILTAGDFNIQESEPDLNEFLTEHDLKCIVKDPTCFKNVLNPSCIDLLITNFPNSFQGTTTLTTGLSDYHKMVLTVLKNKFIKQKPKEIEYRCYKSLDRVRFREELKHLVTNVNTLEEFDEAYLEVVNKYIPLKRKTVRINQAPYMTKALRKAIMRRSALKSKYLSNKSANSERIYKKQKKIVSRLYKKERKFFYDNLDIKYFTDNKKFWKTVKPFLSDRGIKTRKVNLKEGDKIVSDDQEVAEIFNRYFSESVDTLNIQENKFIINSADHIVDPIERAIYKYKNHPSVFEIQRRVQRENFKFSTVTKEELLREINFLNPNKGNTSNSIPVKNLKENIDITGSTLHRIINNDITNSNFPNLLKLAVISPAPKDNDITNKSKYRPISNLSSMSKLYERIIERQISSFIENNLYVYMCGYRKGFSTQFALIKLIEKWKKSIDEHGYAGAIITDLSKAFDTINHELMVAKLNSYGFDRSALLMISGYLKNRWHKTRINASYSSWKELLQGVPQGSVLGPLLFNVYFNDLFYFLEETEAINYADDTNLHACDMDLGNLMRRLEHDFLIVTEWFENNYMKLNESKSHLIVSGHKYEHIFVNAGCSKIWESESEKILGITIDRGIKFEKHLKNILAVAGRKLTALARLSNVLNLKKFRLLLKSFVESQFAYCPLVWMFCSRTMNYKMNKLQERALRILYKDDVSSFEDLLEKDNSVKIHHRNVKLLAKEMYKVHNNILPNVLGEFLTNRTLCYNLRDTSTFTRDKVYTTYYGLNSLRILGPKIWDLLSPDIKSAPNIESFQAKIKAWKIENCPCRLCIEYIGGVGFIS